MKVIAIAILTVFYSCLLSGCTSNNAVLEEDNRFHIVCTTFPQYDWTANLICGNEENISLTLLMDKGGDLHNFQPSALDIARVSECDLFLYVGGESDAWVKDALKEAVNPKMRVINMMEVVSETLVEEEHVAGGSGHNKQEHDEQEYHEHIWLYIRNDARTV